MEEGGKVGEDLGFTEIGKLISLISRLEWIF